MGFLQALKDDHKPKEAAPARSGRNPAIKEEDGLLIFTGDVDNPETDWLQVVREERDAEILRLALGQIEPK